MKIANRSRFRVLLVVLFGLNVKIAAAQAPASPTTFWNQLGIPQGLQKIGDSLVNRRGKHPKLERKPPLKRIADPANLEAENPAIQAAAKIKAKEDQAPQKIKAIKYLATVGCGCYPGVKEALLDALQDCTEDVRYEAAKAFTQAAGDYCDVCSASCCDAEVMTKLHERAYGQDASGCYIESSARVRAAAEQALNACKERIPPGPVAPENGVEYPTEAPPLETPPTEAPPGQPGPPFIEERGLEKKDENQNGDNVSAVSAHFGLAGLSRGRGPQTMDNANLAVAGRFGAGCAPGGCQYGGPGARIIPDECVVPPGLREEAPGEALPGELPPGAAPTEPFAPGPETFAASYGAALGPQSVAPYMIGDSFSGRGTQAAVVLDRVTISTPTAAWQFHYFNPPAIPPAGTDRVLFQYGTDPFDVEGVTFPNSFQTLSANTLDDINATLAPGTPGRTIPVEEPDGGVTDGANQIFVNRHGGGGTTAYTSGALAVPDGRDGTQLNTDDMFYPGSFSYEYIVLADLPSPGAVVGRMKIAENTSPIPRDRLLFDYGLFDSVPLTADGVTVHRFTPGFEKTFFSGRASFEMKIPMGVTLDSSVFQDGGTDLSHGEFGNMALTAKALVFQRPNWAISGGMTVAVPTADDTRVLLADGTPLIEVQNEAVYLQPFFGVLWTPNDRFFAQGFMQWDLAANSNPVLIRDPQREGLVYVDNIHDTTFQYLDIGLGWWSYRSYDSFRRFTGLAWTAELHWNRSLTEADVVNAGNFRIGDFASTVEVFNLTLGAHLELFTKTTVTLAFATPLGGGQDQQFDGEFRLMLNRRFGPQTRATRTPLF